MIMTHFSWQADSLKMIPDALTIKVSIFPKDPYWVCLSNNQPQRRAVRSLHTKDILCELYEVYFLPARFHWRVLIMHSKHCILICYSAA